MIETEFSDILTDFNCSVLVTELIKFILFRKQQIPITYDKLNLMVTKKGPLEATHFRQSTNGKSDLSNKLYRKAEACIGTLNEIFYKTAETFTSNRLGEKITEVALLFGGSILTPKQIYRIEIPPMESGHQSKHHSERKIMSQVLHAITSCDQLHVLLSNPMELTNMFLLIRKSGACHSENWLLPKPGYKIPSFGQHFLFKFGGIRPEDAHCLCKGLNVFSDSDLEIEVKGDSTRTSGISCSEDGMWFLAPQVIKGFKDVYVAGVSVTKEWFHSDYILS